MIINLLSAPAEPTMNPLFTYGLMALVLVGMFWFSSRSQKKKDKAVKDMLAKIEVGTEVVTIGGVVGIVVSVADENVVIETGSNKTRIRFLKEAVSRVIAQENESAE